MIEKKNQGCLMGCDASVKEEELMKDRNKSVLLLNHYYGIIDIFELEYENVLSEDKSLINDKRQSKDMAKI